MSTLNVKHSYRALCSKWLTTLKKEWKLQIIQSIFVICHQEIMYYQFIKQTTHTVFKCQTNIFTLIYHITPIIHFKTRNWITRALWTSMQYYPPTSLPLLPPSSPSLLVPTIWCEVGLYLLLSNITHLKPHPIYLLPWNIWSVGWGAWLIICI